jgi:hypothetical protein
MSAPNYAGVVVRGSGFQPSESLTVDLASGPEGGKQEAKATPQGTYTMAIFPAVKGQKSGKASVAIHDAEMQRGSAISLGRRQL